MQNLPLFKKIIVLLLLVGGILPAQAQDDAAELAKKLANPIASLISVPFQNNTDYGIGTYNGSRNTSSSTVWLIPNISAVTSLGKQKTQFSIGPRFNLAAPNGARADWGWRAAVVFLFPK